MLILTTNMFTFQKFEPDVTKLKSRNILNPTPIKVTSQSSQVQAQYHLLRREAMLSAVFAVVVCLCVCVCVLSLIHI